MPWGLAAAGIGAAGGIASGLIGSGAAGGAAKTQAGAADRATQAQLDMYGQTVAREQPFVSAGTNALTQLQQLLGIGPGGAGATSPVLQMLGIGGPGGTGAGNINPATFQGSPGYQFQLQQGENAVTNATARNPGGNALRALQQVGQQTANQNWNQYLGLTSDAWQKLIGNVAGVAGSGQNAAAGLGAIGTQVGGQVGGNIIGGGNDLAAGQVGSANALTGGLNTGFQDIMTMLRDPNFKRLVSGTGGTYASLDPTGQSIAPNTWSQQPDSYYLPGGAGYVG